MFLAQTFDGHPFATETLHRVIVDREEPAHLYPTAHRRRDDRRGRLGRRIGIIRIAHGIRRRGSWTEVGGRQAIEFFVWIEIFDQPDFARTHPSIPNGGLIVGGAGGRIGAEQFIEREFA